MKCFRHAVLKTLLILAIAALLSSGVYAYTYPSMPAHYEGITVQIGDSAGGYVTLPLAEYPDGAYWSPEKHDMLASEAAKYGITVKSAIALKGGQCVGFGRYAYTACFYRYSKNAVVDTFLGYSSNPDAAKYVEVGSLARGYSAAQAKALITKATPGSILRISGHTMMLMAIFDDGVIIYDANFSSANEVDVRKYTWKELSEKLGARGIEVLHSPAYFPGYTYYYFGVKYSGTAFNLNTSAAGSYISYNNSGSYTLRSGPGTSYEAVGKLPDNTVVPVSGTYNGWSVFYYNNQYCWIPSSYLKVYENKVTVTFDAAGGNASYASAKYTAGMAFGSLPTATKPNRTFAGWYNGSTRCDEKSIAPKTDKITLTAKWYVFEFTDVSEDDWYAGYVDEGVGYGLIMHDTTFRPNDKTTRAEFVTVLGRQYQRMTGKTINDAAPAGFTDVVRGSYYAAYTGWAVKNNIILGTSSTTFSPSESVTREQMATILYRFVVQYGYSKEYTGSNVRSSFPDGSSVSDYAVKAMNWAISIGLFNGDEAGKLNPKSSATRAEMVTVYDRFLSYYGFG